MKKVGQKGFTLIEVLLLIIALGLVAGVGYLVFSNQNDNKSSNKITAPANNDTKQSKASNTDKRYLEVPELGVKLELTDKLKNAYYAKIDGYYYVSVHDIDNTAGLEGCKAGGRSLGINALATGKVGEDNGTGTGVIWTQEDLDKSGMKKVGETYYGFMHGGVACYDRNASNVSQLKSTVSDFMQAFAAQQNTFQKL